MTGLTRTVVIYGLLGVTPPSHLPNSEEMPTVRERSRNRQEKTLTDPFYSTMCRPYINVCIVTGRPVPGRISLLWVGYSERGRSSRNLCTTHFGNFRGYRKPAIVVTAKAPMAMEAHTILLHGVGSSVPGPCRRHWHRRRNTPEHNPLCFGVWASPTDSTNCSALPSNLLQ